MMKVEANDAAPFDIPAPCSAAVTACELVRLPGPQHLPIQILGHDGNVTEDPQVLLRIDDLVWELDHATVSFLFIRIAISVLAKTTKKSTSGTIPADRGGPASDAYSIQLFYNTAGSTTPTHALSGRWA